MRYAALDFETGNASMLSACAIGVSLFEDDLLVDQQVSLIKPPDEVGKFHWGNMRVHGISQSMVANAPSFAEVWERIADMVAGSVLVCHNAMFDIAVLQQNLQYYALPFGEIPYICTVKVAQRVWPELQNHKLNTVAEALSIPLNHHEAGSDALAAGKILLCALAQTQCCDAYALADKIEMRLGMLSGQGKTACSIAKTRKKL